MALTVPVELNDEQRQVVTSADGPSVVVAGPGTGKTRALTGRIAYLLEEKKIPPQKILALTFTKAAAQEMRDRLHASDQLWIHTFHALALKILKENDEVLYHAALEKAEAEEFDEILSLAHGMIADRPDLQASLKTRFTYVLVDEVQDTSAAQYAFLKFFVGPNICVAGDPDQSIYGSLNGGFQAFEVFRQDWPQARVFHLSQNYRSQTSIVEAAKQVIAKNVSVLPRRLQSRLEEGLPVHFLEHRSDKEEATLIARWIERLIGGSSHFALDSEWADDDAEKGRYSLGDIVILVRYHAQASLIKKSLEAAGLPVRCFGKESSKEYEDAEPDPRVEEIRVMTLHRAKGLEFPVVFVAGCEPEIRIHRDTNPAEERRLFYVGMTRAQKRLFLSTARQRFLFGKKWETDHSFVRDIQQEFLKIIKPRPVSSSPKKPVQINLFDGI